MPTVRRCCIVGCLSNSRQNPQLQFFQFPKLENPFHKLWKQACYASLSRILPFKKPVVCSHHFHPSCLGGRRLTASAVPSLRLEVPSNLKAVEHQAMVEEIERSRKCAYINAVVYEWLVRANLNPQLRGSITHGMIKEKADTAKQLIGSTNFVADNRWLNRFRETHLSNFSHKLATNQLKPLGPSLWIPDIVTDLQHLFPPTSADRVAKLENIPEQYIDYMQQYGEFEEEDDSDVKPDVSGYGDQSYQQDQSYQDQSYQEQQQHSLYQQQQQQHHHNQSISDPYQQQPNYNYDDFYYDRQNQYDRQGTPQQQHRPSSHSSAHRADASSPYQMPAKRPKLQDDVGIPNGTPPIRRESVEDLTDGPEVNHNNNNNENKPKTNGSDTPNGHSAATSPSPAASTNGQTNGRHKSNSPPTFAAQELDTYAQALEYLKPLEDFALVKENFRAIGLISQLEAILRKGSRPISNELAN